MANSSTHMLSSAHVTAVVLGGLLAAAAVVLAIRHIYCHLNNFSRPEYQLHIVRILAMVPIYSVTSWIALLITDEKKTLVLELIRDSYEAYVIYNFVVLLINYGGGDLHLCRYLEGQPRMPHPWPGNLWLPPLKLGPAFLNGIRASVLQFVFIKPAGSLLKLLITTNEVDFMRSISILVLAICNNLSVSCALYGLVLFYHAAHDLLLPFQPFEKFLSVKAVVFFSFWQGVVIGLAVKVGALKDVQGFSADEQATGLQDFLICLEMAIAAVTHYYVFSYTEYKTAAYDAHGTYQADSKNPLLQIVDFRDVLSDAKDRIYGGVGFESELRDGAPIAPGVDNILDDVAVEQSTYTKGRGAKANSVSADLMTSPWQLRAPRKPSAPP